MSLNVTYWCLPEEEADLVAFLQRDQVLGIAHREVATAEELVWKPLVEALRDADKTFLISLPPFLSHMRTCRAALGGVCIVGTSAPAIMYERAVRDPDENTLSPASLSLNTSYLADDKKSTVDLPSDFLRWGRRALEWARRAAPTFHRYNSFEFRVTPKAAAAHAVGLHLVA